jgi:uncharacterized membrane protein YozB (DUF420 family)
MTFYSLLLFLHNLLRWAVLILALWALYRAYRGWLRQAAWEAADRKAGLFFTITLDTQLLLGLILYVVSPLTSSAFNDFGQAMQNPELRFFLVEHAPLMIAAVALAHIGSAAAKRDLPDLEKHRRAALWFSLALLAILIAIPWARPLLRLFG